MSNGWMRKLASGVLVLTMALGLSACAEKEMPQPQVTKTAELAVTESRYSAIAQETIDALKAADSARSADTLKTRVMEPLLSQRTAQYRLNGLKDDAAISQIVIDPKATPVESGKDFPRSLFSFSAPVEGQNQRTLTAWQQTDARSNYKLWGQVMLFPEVGLPTLASTLNDSQSVPAPDAAKYVADPAGIVAAYAKYVNSQQLGAVPFQTDDPVSASLKQALTDPQQAVGDKGDIEMSVKDSGTPVVGVATDDGGLVVMGSLAIDVTYTSKDAAQPLILKSAADGISLMYSGDREKTDVEIGTDKPLTAHYSVTIAFYIPPKAARVPNAAETRQPADSQKSTTADKENKTAGQVKSKSASKDAAKSTAGKSKTDAKEQKAEAAAAKQVQVIGASGKVLLAADTPQ